MKSYSKGNIELLVYQQTMVNACIRNADFRSDLYPDPYGYGSPGDIDDIDLMSDDEKTKDRSLFLGLEKVFVILKIHK